MNALRFETAGFIFGIILVICLAAAIIIITATIKKQVEKVLNQNTTVNLVFYSQYIHLKKKGSGIDVDYNINYSDIIRMTEREHFFLIFLKRNRSVYIPKQENSEALSEFFLKQIRKVSIRTHAYYFGKPNFYRLFCLIMPFFAFLSSGISTAMLRNADDLPIWFIFIIFPTASLMSGIYGRRYVAKPLWIFALIIGILTVLFAFVALIAITNT